MNSYLSNSTQLPSIVKYTQTTRNGVQPHTYNRHAIGMVLKGKKYIYYGDLRHEVNKGDLFYLSSGNHYTEDIPEIDKKFEQVIIYFTPEELSRIISKLTMHFGMTFANDHSCANCRGKSHVTYPGWSVIKSYFSSLNQLLIEDVFASDKTLMSIKMTELVSIIFSRHDCCLKTKILEHSDQQKESFEQTMYDNIFKDVSIEDLARQCNRSLTSFKKEFKKHFHEPPHKWFIRQRLTNSRMLLLSTSKSISEIGTECNFPNTSHFIKLFRKEYDMTPATYRNKYKLTGSFNKDIIEINSEKRIIREASM